MGLASGGGTHKGGGCPGKLVYPKRKVSALQHELCSHNIEISICGCGVQRQNSWRERLSDYDNLTAEVIIYPLHHICSIEYPELCPA